MIKLRATVLLAVLVVAGCSRVPSPEAVPSFASQDTVPEGFVGCYELRPGAWERDSLLARFYALETLPRRIELTSRLEHWVTIRGRSVPLYTVQAAPPSARDNARSPFRVWRRDGTSTVYVGEHLPLGGATLLLSRSPEGLAGTLRTFTDVVAGDGRTWASSPVFLDRMECGSHNNF
jgi:hypothetical protein